MPPKRFVAARWSCIKRQGSLGVEGIPYMHSKMFDRRSENDTPHEPARPTKILCWTRHGIGRRRDGMHGTRARQYTRRRVRVSAPDLHSQTA